MPILCFSPPDSTSFQSSSASQPVYIRTKHTLGCSHRFCFFEITDSERQRFPVLCNSGSDEGNAFYNIRRTLGGNRQFTCCSLSKRKLFEAALHVHEHWSLDSGCVCDLKPAQHFHSAAIHKLSSLTTRSFAQHLAHDSGAAYWEMRGEWLPISPSVGPQFKQQRVGWISLLRNIDHYWVCGLPFTLPQHRYDDDGFHKLILWKENIRVLFLCHFSSSSIFFLLNSLFWLIVFCSSVSEHFLH